MLTTRFEVGDLLKIHNHPLLYGGDEPEWEYVIVAPVKHWNDRAPNEPIVEDGYETMVCYGLPKVTGIPKINARTNVKKFYSSDVDKNKYMLYVCRLGAYTRVEVIKRVPINITHLPVWF